MSTWALIFWICVAVAGIVFLLCLLFEPIYMRWKTGNKWWPYKSKEEAIQALIDSGEPILYHDENGRPYLRTKTGPDTYENHYFSG